MCIFAVLTSAKRLLKALVYFYFISLCGACLSPKDVAGTFLCLSDSYNREIKLEKEPEKIISLSPAITEIIFLLNAENKLVGISDYCNFPPETKQIQKIGGLQNINIEKIMSLKPDVVLMGSIIPKNEVEKLEKSGIVVIIIKHEEKLESMNSAFELIGKITNKSQAADSLIHHYETIFQQYQNLREENLKKPTLFYVVGFGVGGDFTAPANSHISEIIALAGGKNIGDTLTTWQISREFLFSQNPDLIFVRTEDFEHFTTTYPYTLLKAVKEKNTFPIESGWIDIVSPRNFLAIDLMHSKITAFTKNGHFHTATRN